MESSDDTIGVVRPDDPSKYEMTLAADGAASFRLDCNRASGRWTATDPTLSRGDVTFSPAAMTRAACLPGSLDTRVARELGYVRRYILEGERLTLTLMADGGSQVWTRAAPEPR